MELISLIKNGNTLEVESLLFSGADPNCVDEHGYSALHWGCQEGDLFIVELLVRCGADIDSQDHEGYTPLEVAINNCHSNIAAYLLASGADATKTRNGFSNLHACAAISDSETLVLLLEQASVKLMVNSRDEGGIGRAPLHWAAQSGAFDAATLLLSHGADAASLDGDGFAPQGLRIKTCQVHDPKWAETSEA
jgi:ankyrin repeat protein